MLVRRRTEKILDLLNYIHTEYTKELLVEKRRIETKNVVGQGIVNMDWEKEKKKIEKI